MNPRIPLPFALLVLASCGPSNCTVSGTVSFKGQKVPSGTVTFVSGAVVVQATIEDGRYEIKNVPSGEAIVTVTRLDPSIPDPNESLLKLRKQMMEKQIGDPKAVDSAVVTDATEIEAIQKKRHLLPYYYADTSTSYLRFTVVSGANIFNIQLLEK